MKIERRDRGLLRSTRAATIAAIVSLALVACEKVSPTEISGGSALLTWTPVTSDVNGRALPNIAGYKVSYGPSPRALFTVVVLPDPKLTRYTVSDLAAGTWYFSIAAYTSSNVQGAQSNVASKTIK